MNLFHSLHYQTHRMRVWIHLLGQRYVSFWGPLVLKSVQLYQTLLSEDDHSFPRGGGVRSCGREGCVCAGVGWMGVSPPYTGVIILRNGPERNSSVTLFYGTEQVQICMLLHMTAKRPYCALKCTSYRQ